VALQGGREAEILGRLNHANIVPVYSIQEDETGLTGFCMPYLGKATLAAVLDCAFASGRLPAKAHAILDAISTTNQGTDVGKVPTAEGILRSGSYVNGVVRLGVQLAEALSHAHANGICHRDIKPSNILMSPDGRPLLLDFNLSVDDRHPTWRIGGTLPYMAPEELTALVDSQLPGDARRYDPRSDVFSLGVVLYELLTGSLPFGSIACDCPVEDIARQLRQRQGEGPRPIKEQNCHVDERLACLINGCLSFEPDGRPTTAEALAVALRKELAFPRRARHWLNAHRRSVLAALAALVIMIVSAIAYYVSRPPYSVRLFQRAIAYSESGRDDLAIECLNASLQYPSFA
jgi:serine/threonine protein kinase